MTIEAPDNRPMETVAGLATSRGLVAGTAFLYGVEKEISVPDYVIPPEGVEAELTRFRTARGAARIQLEMLVAEVRESSGQTQADIFANHLALMQDEMIIAAVEDLIRTGRNCESALRESVNEFRAVFAKMKDPYLRERVRDVDDIERRLLRVLLKLPEQAITKIDHPVILVAPELTPSETISLPKEFIIGIATDRGSTTSHVALLARSLGIPAVVGLGDITARVRTGDEVLLDGTNGAVTLHPDAVTRDEFGRLLKREKEISQLLAEEATRTGALKDGTPLRFLANVQPGTPFGNLAAFGAQGIGLYRSEYLWIGSDEEPSEELQFQTYLAAVKAVESLGGESRVVFRTLDIGGDKLPKGRKSLEANPFLGCRSVRWSLVNLSQFRTQLRAMLRASAYGRTSIMFPMVSTMQELRSAKAEVRLAMEELKDERIAFDPDIDLGVMIEVPAAAINAAAFAKECDFLSIGTNDLIQYTMAADRGNTLVAHLYQPTNPAVLFLIDRVAAAGKAAGIPVSVCGEAASDPILAALFVAFGVTSLSMSAGFLPIARKVLRAFDRKDLDELAAKVREASMSSSSEEVYSLARDFLLAKVPDLEQVQSFFTAV